MPPTLHKAGVKLGTDPVIQIREIEKFENFQNQKSAGSKLHLLPTPTH